MVLDISACLETVVDRFAGDHVDRASDGICTEKSRTAASDYLNALNHVDRHLFKSIDTRQRTDNRTAVDEDLGVCAFEAVDAQLRKSAVLTIVLDSQAGLIVESLSEVGRVDSLEELVA